MFELKSKTKTATDHLGQVFPSFGKMCEHYDIPYITAKVRLRKGWTLEKTLTEPLRCQIEYKGKKYSSLKELSSYFSVSYYTIKQRLCKGMPLEQALTQELQIKPVTYNGRTYRSLTALCKHLDIDRHRVYYHLNKGKDLSSIIDLMLSKKKGITVGNRTYTSVKEIALCFGVSPTTVRRTLAVTKNPQSVMLLLEKSRKHKRGKHE